MHCQGLCLPYMTAVSGNIRHTVAWSCLQTAACMALESTSQANFVSSSCCVVCKVCTLLLLVFTASHITALLRWLGEEVLELIMQQKEVTTLQWLAHNHINTSPYKGLANTLQRHCCSDAGAA